MGGERLLVRQAYSLWMVHASGEAVRGRTRFQKMMFLLREEMERMGRDDSVELGFVPHHYGPYSRQLQDDIEALIGEGMIEERPEESQAGQYMYRYRATGRGNGMARSLLDPRYEEYGLDREAYEVVCRIKKRVNGMEIRDLLEEVYAAHPEYAQYSKYEF